jgi:hypothetical protein
VDDSEPYFNSSRQISNLRLVSAMQFYGKDHHHKMRRPAITALVALASLIVVILSCCLNGKNREVETNTTYLAHFSTSTQTSRSPHCEDVDGILFISRVIRKAGAGTMFYQSLVDSLLFAQKYNLLPFIWINDDENQPCYDSKVHGVGPNRTFTHLTGSITNLIGQGAMECNTNEGTRPGPPSFQDLRDQEYTLIGNGLWQSYFEPIPFPFDDPSCRSKPVFEMTRSQIMPDMHRCSELAVRGWTFQGIPQALLPNDRPMADWLWDHRQRAAPVVQRYFNLHPWLEQRIREANPNPRHCLAVHIRLTDKASGRDKKGLDAYRPYVEAYANATAASASSSDGNNPIYIATDDGTVLQTIQRKWSNQVAKRVIYQAGAFRSEEEDVPTFKLLGSDKHRSNTEALVEINAMARCSYFVHGYSGMAEAVVYINPRLHSRSVNIDDEERISSKTFQRMVRSKEQSRIRRKG